MWRISCRQRALPDFAGVAGEQSFGGKVSRKEEPDVDPRSEKRKSRVGAVPDKQLID